MDFFTGKKPTNPGEQDQPSATDLFSSAKVVADAAQSSFNKKDTNEIDKAKVADAADDLLEAASRYGKLEEKGYGQYVEKAESYLHQYNTNAAAAPAGDQGKAPPLAEAKADEAAERPPPVADLPSGEEKEGGEEKTGGGFGGALKMAQGLLQK